MIQFLVLGGRRGHEGRGRVFGPTSRAEGDGRRRGRCRVCGSGGRDGGATGRGDVVGRVRLRAVGLRVANRAGVPGGRRDSGGAWWRCARVRVTARVVARPRLGRARRTVVRRAAVVAHTPAGRARRANLKAKRRATRVRRRWRRRLRRRRMGSRDGRAVPQD